MDYESPEGFGSEILLGFKKAAAAYGWGVEVIPATPEFQAQAHYDAFMMEHKHAGAFFMGFSLGEQWMQELSSTTYPTVLLDNAVEDNALVSFIGTSSGQGIRLAIDRLADLGHEKIAFLNGSAGSLVSDLRMSAYLSSMSARRLSIDPDLAVYGYFVAEAARYHVPGFLDAGATAILCGNDLIAQGVLDCCREAGFSVPEDVSVIGFDDLPLASRLDPPLTSVRQPLPELGKSAFYALCAALNGVPLSRTELRPTLVERKSTGPAKPRVTIKREHDPDSVASVNPELYYRFAHPRGV